MKVRINICISEELDERLKSSPINRSEVCEEAMIQHLNGISPITEIVNLKKRIAELERALSAIQQIAGEFK